MSMGGHETTHNFILVTDTEIDLALVKKSLKKIVIAIRSFLSLEWFPGNVNLDPGNYGIRSVREKESIKFGKVADLAHLYCKKY